MKFLVTAGPTREPIDPVRYISNRSTGRMGFAVAEAARDLGHQVTLITGPVALTDPDGIHIVHVTTAAEMHEAVLKAFDACDALVMAAAVADWTPASMASQKLKKDQMPSSVELSRTTDILLSVKALANEQIVVGFAAETENLHEEAKRKLAAKGLHLVVANNVAEKDAGFGTESNRVTFFASNGEEKAFPLMSKYDVGREIVGWIAAAS